MFWGSKKIFMVIIYEVVFNFYPNPLYINDEIVDLPQ